MQNLIQAAATGRDLARISLWQSRKRRVEDAPMCRQSNEKGAIVGWSKSTRFPLKLTIARLARKLACLQQLGWRANLRDESRVRGAIDPRSMLQAASTHYFTTARGHVDDLDDEPRARPSMRGNRQGGARRNGATLVWRGLPSRAVHGASARTFCTAAIRFLRSSGATPVKSIFKRPSSKSRSMPRVSAPDFSG